MVLVGGDDHDVPLPGVRRLTWDELVAHDPTAPSADRARRPEDDLAYIFTSGTTGPSKAVRCSHLAHDAYPEQPGDADVSLRVALVVPAFAGVEEFGRRFNVQMWTGYAMTEVPGPLRTHLNTDNPRTAGLPTGPGWEVQLVDEHDRPVGDGELGELLVRHQTPGVVTAARTSPRSNSNGRSTPTRLYWRAQSSAHLPSRRKTRSWPTSCAARTPNRLPARSSSF
ncbi:AMP-binding protein [Phytohabitans suffuscus]|uniref:AMP-binding protein n=1 Tax=Phytohabitans suffuscus TaxID=624315 RepID=UPI001E4BD753|nr:AMP-binding protein [Phytohabitans suffuscus]